MRLSVFVVLTIVMCFSQSAQANQGNSPPLQTITYPQISSCSAVTLDAGCESNNCYNWSTGESGVQTLTVNASGIYTVELGFDLDNDGVCDFTYAKEFDVTILATPTLDLGADQLLCYGTTTELDAGAGHSSYLWSNGETTQKINVDSSGTFSVEVTNSSGCSASDEIEVDFRDPIVLSLTATGTCGTSGEVLANVLSGGTAPFTYLWSDGQTSQLATKLTAGNYSVTVTDASGCTEQAATVVAPSQYCTTLYSGYCGITRNDLNDYIYVNPVAGATMYWYRFYKNGILVAEIQSNQLDISGRPRIQLHEPTTVSGTQGILYDGDYDITISVGVDQNQDGITDNSEFYSENIPCTIHIIGSTTFLDGYCGITRNDLNDFIYGTPRFGAIEYEYKFYQNSVLVAQLRSSQTDLSGRPRIHCHEAGLRYGETYDMTINFAYDLNNNAVAEDNEYLTPSTPCPLYIGTTTTFLDGYCGITRNDLNDFIYGTPRFGAIEYEYKFYQNSVLVAQLRSSQTDLSGRPRIHCHEAGLLYGETYDMTINFAYDLNNNAVAEDNEYFTPSTPCPLYIGSTTTFLDGYCGITRNDLNDFIYGTPRFGAIEYEYKFYQNSVLVAQLRSSQTDLSGRPRIHCHEAGLLYGETYDMTINFAYDLNNNAVAEDNEYFTPSTPCPLYIGSTTTFLDGYCGITIDDLNDFIYGTPRFGAIEYEYKFYQNSVLVAQLRSSQTDLSGRPRIRCNEAGLAHGQNYVMTINFAYDLDGDSVAADSEYYTPSTSCPLYIDP